MCGNILSDSCMAVHRKLGKGTLTLTLAAYKHGKGVPENLITFKTVAFKTNTLRSYVQPAFCPD